MALAGSVGLWLLLGCLGATPIAILLFRPRVMGGGLVGNLRRMWMDYWPYYLVFIALVWSKQFVNRLNHPVRGVLGDFTGLVFGIEGDMVYRLQALFESPALTTVLNVNYVFAFTFMIYLGVVLASYADDRELAGKFALNYVVVYVLAVPFYIFFNVQVAHDHIPGMKALLYHWSPGYFSFFTATDTLDNAFPSLHVGIPWGMFLLMWWTMRQRGRSARTWSYRGFLWFTGLQLVVFCFSILYLGIHWATDIVGGLLIGLLGAVIVEEMQAGFFRRYLGAVARARGVVGGLLHRVGVTRRRPVPVGALLVEGEALRGREERATVRTKSP